MKPETALANLDKATQLLASCESVDDVKHVVAMAEAATNYAQRMKMGSSTIAHAVGLRVDATRLLGKYLIEAPRARKGRPKKGARAEHLPTLKELNLDKKESAAAQKIAKLRAPAFATFRKERIDAALGLKPKKDPEFEIDDSDECYTPAEWIDRARRVMGRIGYDPFSCELAQQIVQAERFGTIEDSAFDTEWTDDLWFQPPFSTELIKDATNKFFVEMEAGRVTQAIGLTNTCSTSPWWQRIAKAAAVVCFPAERINFLRPIGGGEVAVQKGNRADQTFFYFGPSPHVFEYEFGEVGVFGRLRGNL